MQRIARAISPRAARKFETIFSNRHSLAKTGRNQIRRDCSAYPSNSNLKHHQHPDMLQSYDFSTTIYQEAQQSVDQISILKATEYSMLAQYSRYVQEIQEIQELENLKKKQPCRKYQKTNQRLYQLTQKLESCSQANLKKIKKDLTNNKTHAYYRRKAIEHAVYAKCNHMLAEDHLSKKEHRQKLYQIVRNDWAHSARRAYWPRLLGGSMHITGAILSVAASAAGQTGLGLIAHFFMGFNRIVGDATMGIKRLEFKAFEEINNNYVFFKPAGIIDNDTRIQDAHASFKQYLNLVNEKQHPRLTQVLSGRLSNPKINEWVQNFNADELALARDIKANYKKLRAARHREKIESSGSMGQLRNNLLLGGLQLSLNLLKCIPSFTLQIALAGIGLLGALTQHTINYRTAPDDFCRKMEQNCISQLNLAHDDNSFKIKVQKTLAQMKELKKLNNQNTPLNSNADAAMQQKIYQLLDKNTELKTGFMKSGTLPLTYRLKNLLEYQNIMLAEREHQKKQRVDNILELTKLLKNTAPYDKMDAIRLEKYINHLDCTQQIDSIDNAQQRKWIRKIADLKTQIKLDDIHITNMSFDFDCLKKVEKSENIDEIKKNAIAIRSPQLKKALNDADTAIKLIIQGKKMLNDERFRYFISYIAPSILSMTILAPLLAASATLPANSSEQMIVKNTNSCVTNIVAAGQQVVTGSNNAKRDEHREGIKNSGEQDDKCLLRTHSGQAIKDTRAQYIASKSTQKAQKRLRFKFFVDCALAPITAPMQHIKANKSIQKYSYMMSELDI